jgi:hypothetical protein
MARKTKTAVPDDDFIERIVDIDVSSEMETSFLEYAYSVIYSRALPETASSRCSAGSSTRCVTWACCPPAAT